MLVTDDPNDIQALVVFFFSGAMAKRVAVILAGCGVYDGTEIHEASAILVHLSRAGAKVKQDSHANTKVDTNVKILRQFVRMFFFLGPDVCSEC